MYRKFALAGAVLAAAVSLTSIAFAGANDYAFEPVKAELKKGNGVTLTVRLVHKPTGKPVSDAVIISPRIDMSPEGMATMTASASMTSPSTSTPRTVVALVCLTTPVMRPRRSPAPCAWAARIIAEVNMRG